MSWITLPDPPAIIAKAHLPDAAVEGLKFLRRTIKGTPVTILKHDYQTWMTLRSRGMLAPHPMERYKYPGRFTPMEHQRRTAEFFAQHIKCFCTNGLRTGKTLSAIWAADYLMEQKAIRRVLIVAPLSICEIVWERELFKTLSNRRVAVLKGTRARKRQIAQDTRFDFIVVNPESLELVRDQLPLVDLVIVDEFTKFKNHRANRYKALHYVASERRLWMLSATPAPQRPTDAYGPIRLVNPKRVGFKAFESMTMLQVSKFTWINKKECDVVIADWMQPAIRYKREDCIEIPDKVTENLNAGLTDKQLELIKAFADKAMTEMDGTKISAPNAAAVLTKTLQVMAGGVYGVDADGERVTHKVPADPYFEAVEEVVEQASGPVLIFTSFQSSVTATYDYLVSKGYRVAKVMSGTKNRMAIFDQVQHGELDAIVAIPETMSHGLNLAASSTVLWASPPFSFETYDQANHRVLSSDQKNKVLVLHLIQNALSLQLFKRLETREKLQDSVLTLLEGRI